MKFRHLAFNLFVATLALFIGIGWVSVFRYFAGNSVESKQEIAENHPLMDGKPALLGFDIDDPNSELPIDHNEDELTSPHGDESNAEMFDPEGYYFFDGNPEGFEDFYYISINNKNLSGNKNDKRFGESMPLGGYVMLERNGKVQYLDFKSIAIENGKLSFETETKNGVKYDFEGDFRVKGNFYTLDENTKVLKGSLSKQVDGKVSAQSNFSFNWMLELGCGL